MIHTIKLDILKSISINPAGDKVRLQVNAGGVPVLSHFIPVEVADLLANALVYAAEEARAGVGS